LTIAAVEERERAYKESKISKHPGNQKSNVPEWSQPNYVNTTSEETKEELKKRKQEMLKRFIPVTPIVADIKYGFSSFVPCFKINISYLHYPNASAFPVSVYGIDISFSEERGAIRFVSRAVALQVAKALRSFGNFYVIQAKG